MANTLDAVMDRIEAEAEYLQERTRVGMRHALRALAKGENVDDTIAKADITRDTFYRWRRDHPAFAAEVKRYIRINEEARIAATEARRTERNEESPTLQPDRGRNERPSLTDFRMEYFGRPTPPHQQAAVKALEDQTNNYVFIFGPTGMGKDTLAGDYVAWEVAPDDSGKRVAWFMESEDFSARRLERLARYMTDPKVYDHKPTKTPGGAKPSRSLITDYGPFRWEKNMRHPDGTKVERTQWDRLKKYFVRVQAPEQDPNLWATGVGGATYGSRIDVCVCSDIFTLDNQRSPTVRRTQYSWIEGTLDTRLDEDGRLVVIGTMLPIENNYERMIEEYTANARVVDEEQIGPGRYVKYSNGVAIVIVKAIQYNPDTGEEESYWPERFPLDTTYRYKGKDYLEKELSVEKIRHYAEKGASIIRGLRWRRERSPAMFKAMYQQERDEDIGGDFTQATLDRSKDDQRSFGRVKTNELLVVGVDPARRYGAGWVALAVDRTEETVTVADFYFGENLGVTGIKSRLVLEPLTKWNPIWFCYETNVESAVLDDPLIKEAIRESGVSVATVHTGKDRSRSMVSEVGSIAAYMRTGQFRVPYADADDRAKAEILFSHFKAWDSSDTRSRAGHGGHDPDDLAMATRAGWDKCLELINGRGKRRNQNTGVPDHIRRKFDRMKKKAQATKAEITRPGYTAEELVASFVGDTDDYDFEERG